MWTQRAQDCVVQCLRSDVWSRARLCQVTINALQQTELYNLESQQKIDNLLRICDVHACLALRKQMTCVYTFLNYHIMTRALTVWQVKGSHVPI